jgi:hypothetical protein
MKRNESRSCGEFVVSFSRMSLRSGHRPIIDYQSMESVRVESRFGSCTSFSVLQYYSIILEL